MACRRSGVRVPVAPPTATRPPTTHPSPARRGVSRLRGRTVTDTAPPTRPNRPTERAPGSSATTPPRSSRAGRRAGTSSACTRRTSTTARGRKFYLLTMYPYPSGDLHIGHWYIITPTDAIARFQRMHGENVFLPIGFDAFGLPAENAAIKNNINPRDWTMREHRQHAPPAPDDGRDVRLGGRGRHRATPTTTAGTSGCSSSSSRPASPTAQTSPVDWCPNDGTLAREQVEGADRHCWRCGAKVEKRELAQWYLRVTNYADELLDFCGLDWPEPIQAQQTNWIGRSEGGEIVFETAPSAHHAGGEELRVFTTRPDTLFGATFMVLAPEHPLVATLTAPGPARRGRGLRRRRRRTGPRSTACRPTARRPASRSAPTRSTRSTASGSRSSSPTTCWAATAPARSWPSPPTTSATSRSRSKFGLPIRRVVAAPGRRRRAPTRRGVRRPRGRRGPRQQRAVHRAARPTRAARRSSAAGGAAARARRPSPTACATG